MRPVWTTPTVTNGRNSAKSGFFFALSAYSIWGMLPLYWILLEHAPTLEVLAHRALWSLPVAAVILVAIGRTADIIPTLKDRKKLGVLLVCSVIISSNWGVFIWAVANEHTIDAALAYYINPLLSICLGVVFLGERFNQWQLAAILLAALAVLLLTFAGGKFPWISLFLAGTFALYGLLRKTVDVGPTQGFLIEILLVAIIAGGYILWLVLTDNGQFLTNTPDTLLLIGCGPVTAIPLILFASGAKRLQLSTVGLMQYIVPTSIFVIGVFVFREPLDHWQLAAFALIWVGLALYSWSTLAQGKENQGSN